MALSSIFNDVLGPVMRGPSSSHSAAACRMGLMLRDLMHGEIQSVVIDYDPNGSLVTTHESQGTDMGLYGGLIGWKADDPRMKDYKSAIESSGMSIQVNYVSYNAPHPNYYRIQISNEDVSHSFSAISTGGGMMEVLEIDGSQVSMCGDFHELLIYGENFESIKSKLPQIVVDDILVHDSFIELKSFDPISKETILFVEAIDGVREVCYLRPVVPVLTSKSMQVPFIRVSEMSEIGIRDQLTLPELAMMYESSRAGVTESEVWTQMKRISEVMRQGIETGLAGTEYEDRILPVQSIGFEEAENEGTLLDAGMLNTMVKYTTAMMEVKSGMEVFVAAPTAGSCGALPGAIFGAADYMGATQDQIINALFCAGIVGVFIAEHATFSAEVAGCQAETGAGGCMAAAGLVNMAGGTLEQSITAASLALQNSLGIICDPIGNRVEAPCLGKNVMAASNALSCANMALSGYDALIPLDEVIDSMKKVGDMMAHELRCTGFGGLAVTPTAKAIEEKLREKARYC